MRICGGELRGRILKTAEGPGYRPATSKTREAIFSMLAARGVDWPATVVLDAFAGSGSLGFEALSRGAAQVCFVEKGRRAAGLIQENARLLCVADRVRVEAKDVFPYLAAGPQARGFGPFDLVCVDPPYGQNFYEPTLDALLGKGWLAAGGLLLAEVEAKLDNPLRQRPELILLADRAYGQTRILLWKQNAISPSTPEPSIP